MKCVLKYPKKENTKRPEPTNNFDSGRILSINGSLKFEITAKRLYAASQRVL